MSRFNLQALLLALGVVVIGDAAFTGTQGRIGYFSPHTLEYASQSEFTLFFGALPIYRSAPQVSQFPLIAMITDEGFVAPVQADDSRQELVFHWNNAWRDGYGPLYDLLVRHDKQIIAWSKANPDRAQIFWEQGFKYLRSHNDVDVWIGREILSRAWECSTIPELEERIASIKKSIDLL